MAGDFLGEPIIGSSDNFLVTVPADTPAARSAAQAVLDTAEDDLRILEDWFSYSWANFSKGIWVSVTDTGIPSAANRWFGTSQSPQIAVYGASIANAGGSAGVRDELARMLFVAELSEVLMRAAPTGWNPSNNAGEALSRVAAAELHPQGYYRPRGTPNNGPYATAWVQLNYRRRDIQDADSPGQRYDFITVSENSDSNVLSFGCGILFLYYLRYQLRFTWKQIASSWGAHLCETYGQLTGRPPHSAFTEFSDVLNAHLPPGTGARLVTENVFPLSNPPRVVLLPTYGATTSHARTGPLGVEGPPPVPLRAGPLCDERPYSYTLFDVTGPVSVQARAPGSALPTFTWSVNGVNLPSTGPGQVTIPVRVVDTTPAHGEAPREGVPLRLQFTVTNTSGTSQVDLVNLDFPGNVESLTIRASMVESGLPAGAAVITASVDVVPTYRDYGMERQWYLDVDSCNPHVLGNAALHRSELLRKIADLKNLPDPPPEQLHDLVESADRYAKAAAKVTASAPNIGTTLRVLLPDTIAAARSATLAVDLQAGAQHFTANFSDSHDEDGEGGPGSTNDAEQLEPDSTDETAR
jgi:hypothetical protein